MKKIITLLLALAIGFGLKAQCPLTQAVDFTATDIHGTEVHLFDILNSGQYVLIDFFFTTCGPCQQATPKVTESYYAMGCNMHDVFYIEIATGDSETNCLNWVNTYGIEYPTISGTAGGTGICSTYQIGAFPSVILIAPNRQIVIQDLWPINNAQSIITALEAQGLQQHDCNGTTYHPLVGISVAQVMETEVTATFTPNEDCVSYAYMLATENEMQEWTSSTGIGLPEYLWNYGIHNSGVFTHWFSNLTPNTEYVIYAVSVDINGSLGEVVQEAVTTLPSSSTHGYVDLGLPSGLLWAICNVGANATEEYGDYFAWGETQPKDDYSWNTYQYSNGIYGNALTKYCTNSSYGYNGFTDNLTILLPEDDAATANWGNDWRMPTKEEWQELCNNTTVIWTIQNGVRGRLFTAANGNSLFLPAAGFRTDDLHYYAGSFGDYWSSSLNTDVPDGAWGLDFGSGNEYNLSGYSRACGFTVRPVRAGVQNYAPTGAINGLFSVGEGQQVYFSQGNLQYHATSNIWRFALNQFDCVGEDNSNISPTYNGWIDLFGWGTGNNPTNSSTNGEEYNTFNEWGNNIITNGDNTTVWRTLTNEEWQYLYFERNTASGIRFVLARVDNRCGLVLLPDSWSSSIYNLNNVNNVWGYNDNIITASVWASVFEPNGAVFLPAAGGREEGTIIEGLDWNGEYWSSTPSYYNPFHAWFHGSNIGTDTGHPSYYGKSVRLVHPVGSAATYTISATANPSNGGTVTGGGTYNQDATCTLTATANIGYSFVNWTENGDVVSTNASYSFTVAGNRSLVANFLGENSCVITFDLYDSYGDGWNGNTLVVTDDSGSSSELTFEDGSSSTQILMFVNGSHVTLTWIEGSWMGECSFTISYSSGDVIYHGENLNGDFMYEFDVNCNGSSDITQTTDLAQGWNWWSTYVEQDGIDGLAMLEESLGTNGYQIKSQTDFVTNYGSMWFGMLSSITNEETYMIDNTTSCQIEMTGAPVTPSDHPITVSSGWNWIGYPCTNTMSVSEAFSGYTPANGDQVKSQSDYAIYYSGMWIGQLQSITPGTGLMYLSNNTTSTTLVYPDGGRSTEIPTLPKATHWTNDIHAYPHNMTVMAVVELDDVELTTDNYELAAFDANGECRGSAKLTYVEPLNRYVAFLTIAGNDAVELGFRLYDAETGAEYYDAEESLSFAVNATIGEPEDVFVVHFRGTTGMDELASSVQVYPNPVNGGEQFSIGVNAESKAPVRVEIVNAMGVETLRATSTQMPAMLTAPSVAGVYTMRITVEGKGTVVRKLVVK